ncbi:MAG TPA: relaxase/mobilization nuclease domain-containing protein, partial [Puia sp.]
KVKKGQAERIYAGNFLEEASELGKERISERLENLMELNQRVEKKGATITLSFSPLDPVDNEKLRQIAADYMEGIGYGRQPFVVYRHSDTFTPHLHIVSANIRPDGKKINLRFFAGWYLMPLLRAIEEKFGLKPGDGDQEHVLGPATPGRKLIYGEKPTTQAIAEVVQYVREHYRFRSVSELNAILRRYNVIVKTGKPGSRLREFGGLLYQALDDEGKGRGTPVKASNLAFKPILKALNEDFAKHCHRDNDLRDTRVGLFSALGEGRRGKARFLDGLRRQSLDIAPDVDESGKVIGVLLVNLQLRVVVRGEELGEQYSLEAMRNKLGFDPLSRMTHAEIKLELEQHKRNHKRGLRR